MTAPLEAVEQARALHRADDCSPPHCVECSGPHGADECPFPCRTRAILDAVAPDAPVTVETVEELRALDPVTPLLSAGGLLMRAGQMDYSLSHSPMAPEDLGMLPATVLAPATPERTAPVTGREFVAAVMAERATHASRGYDAAHDAEQGVERLLTWAMDRAQRGEHIKSWAIVQAARELLVRSAPVTVETVEDAYESLIERFTLSEVVEYTHRNGLWCCAVGCGGGGCESCPCCAAGWCVSGNDGLPDDPDGMVMWLEVASEHNPLAAKLATVLAPATPERTEQERRGLASAITDALHRDSPHLNRDQNEASASELYSKVLAAIAAYEGREMSQ